MKRYRFEAREQYEDGEWNAVPVEDPNGAYVKHEEAAKLEPAAECWDALCYCYRITCMGSAGLASKFADGYAHATFNLWTHRGPVPEGANDRQDRDGRIRLGEFMLIAVANAKAAK